MNRMEIRLAGSGGQGVILATIILAEAALEAGKYTAQSQSYGPEARGGSCKAEVLVSDTELGYTKVQNPTFFMALTQDSLEKYAKSLDRDCLILVDSSLKVPEYLNAENVSSGMLYEMKRSRNARGGFAVATVKGPQRFFSFLGAFSFLGFFSFAGPSAARAGS